MKEPLAPLAPCQFGRWSLQWGSKTFIMGIVNVTPDSFSGDGLGYDVDRAVAQALAFQSEGADVIDVGGESNRPGFTPVDTQEELRRVLPLVERLAGELSIPLSIDTYKLEVAHRALEAGASILNDIWGLKVDSRLAELAARHGAPIILMHNQHGTEYADLIPDMTRSLAHSMALAEEAGVPRERIILDPGIGFGKTPQHNLEVLRRLVELRALGRPLLVGTSRKSTIGLVMGLPVEERLEGTAATVAIAIANGADIVRVHDVKAMARVARMSDVVVRGWDPSQRR